MPVATALLALWLTGTLPAGDKAAVPPGQSGAADTLRRDPTPAHASGGGISGDALFGRLVRQNRVREEQLQRYSALRTYEVKNTLGKVQARTVVRVHYEAPGTKTFTTVSEEGSRIVRSLVFKGLMESEVETAAGRSHRDSSISPDNYSFQLLGQEDLEGRHCFVVAAVPKRRDKYLFEGTVWVDAQDFAIVKISGRPAKNLSFWITKADFVRQYRKVGDFWLPAKDETLVHVRLYGTRILTIDHRDYAVNGDAPAEKQARPGDGQPQPPVP